MARATLLNVFDPWFGFEHAMAHRNALAVIGFQPAGGTVTNPIPARPPLSKFSAIPYFIDPMQNTGRRAGKWHLNHQQAHDDAFRNLPSQYYFAPPPPGTLGSVTFGLRIGGNLVDTSFADDRQLKWWEFQNHIEHYVGSTVIAPAPAPKPAPQSIFPFW